MSNLMCASRMEGATPVSIGALGMTGGRPLGSGFQARFVDGQKVERQPVKPEIEDVPLLPEAPAIDPIEQARADAFAQGFDEGMRVASEELAVDEQAKVHLADALAQIAPASQGALSALLSAAVLRLVTQVVGEVQVDAALLAQRVEAVAAFIDEEQSKQKLCLHPDDIALLSGHEFGLELTPDPTLGRGGVRLDTVDGWIEDGPDVQLSRLKAMLDTMEGQG